MKQTKLKAALSLATGAIAALALSASAQTQATNTPPTSTSDPLVDLLIKKGILTGDEAKQIKSEMATAQTNVMDSMPASKWRISNAIKDIGLFGDLRLRYEYRSAKNAPPGIEPQTFNDERFRYALRIGLRGDLYDNFNYGIRLETGTNPRSTWVTFANDSNPTPSAKNNDGIFVGQAYIGWHPTSWYEMTVGRMPMLLYTTPMVWDSDICPEGAFEKFKYSVGNWDLFADFGQFDYENPASANVVPSGDTFILAWQAGANVNICKDMSAKIAPVLYTYTGVGSTNGPNAGLALPFSGQGTATGLNPNNLPSLNQNGINSLMVLDIPGEFDFKIHTDFLGPLQGRFFGDFAVNLDGSSRANTAARIAGLSHAYTSDVKAYQFGFGIGSAGPVYGPTQGLVYGTTSKKNIWEARVYWQHVEQYALDVNLIDSDFFEGRGNLEGIYSAFAYSFTDAIIGTVRYGYAHPINNNLGTGGSNPDIPGLNPIKDYNIAQLDLTFRF